jgi:hypothetical protein
MTDDGKVVPVYRSRRAGDDPLGGSKRSWRGGGFMAIMEVGQDNNNLHVHAVCYGHYNAYTGMSAAWSKITGDSVNPDFEPVRDPTRAANYVLKYITKPPRTDSFNRLAEYAGMVKGSRRLRTGGIFYNALTLKPEKTDLRSCPFCGDGLMFKGYLGSDDVVGKARQAMLIPLAAIVKDRNGLLPEWSSFYGRALMGDLCRVLH